VINSFDFKCIEDGRDITFELDINDCTNDLRELRIT
jgi:hypothetical protein